MDKVYKAFALVSVLLVALLAMAFTREYTPNWKGEQEVGGLPWRQGLFEENCASCHGQEGQGRVSGRAPAIGNPDFLKQADEEFLFQTVKYGRPGTNMMPHGMQDVGVLSDTLILEIVSYLRSMQSDETSERDGNDKTKTEPGVITGSIRGGEQLYTKNCAQCHGSAGQGVVGPELKSHVFQDNASDEFIKQTITRGRLGTPMSPYGKGAGGVTELSEQQINDLVLYIRTLKVTN